LLQLAVISLVLPVAAADSPADETNSLSIPSLVEFEGTNFQGLLQAVLQLQGQLHSNRVAIEQNEQTVKETALQNAGALSNGLQTIGNALSAQGQDFAIRSSRELEALQNSNRSVLVGAGSIAAIAFLAILVTGYFQWRTTKAWADISAVLPAARDPRNPSSKALGGGTQPLVAFGSAEDSSLRLIGAIEKLEKRIRTLEQGENPALTIPSSDSDNLGGRALPGVPPVGHLHDVQVVALVKLGQARLKNDDAEGALDCFEQALALDPSNGSAMVKRGVALEQLKRVPEALESYDRAIAVRTSKTSAYLHKGILFNRLERFPEALDCYQKALRTQDELGE
jgi:tetratricopeptide (TPR) repeat protein